MIAYHYLPSNKIITHTMRVSARQQQQEGDKLSNLIFPSSEEEDNGGDETMKQPAMNGKPLLMNSRPSLLQKSIMRSQ